MNTEQMLVELEKINNRHQLELKKIDGRYKIIVAMIWFMFAIAIGLPFVSVWLMPEMKLDVEVKMEETKNWD